MRKCRQLTFRYKIYESKRKLLRFPAEDSLGEDCPPHT